MLDYELGRNLKRLRDEVNSEFPIYIVGGAIRNFVLGLPIKDIDLATPLSPAEILSFFPDGKMINSAQAYPIVSYMGFEIASFRKDGVNRSDASGISLGATMEEDAMRRDFSINALYAPLTFSNVQGLTKDSDWGLDYEDPTSFGEDDLDDGLIRLIGYPEDRLNEDPLRALRAYRFLATLPNFDLEENTKLAVDNVLAKVRMKQ